MKTLLNTLNANQKETFNAVIKMVKEHLDYFDEEEIVICQNGIRYEGWYYGEPANVVCVYGEEPYINYYEEDGNLDDELIDFTEEENAEVTAEEAMQKEMARWEHVWELSDKITIAEEERKNNEKKLAELELIMQELDKMEEKQMKKQNTNILKDIWKSFCREGIAALLTVMTIIAIMCGITGKANPNEAFLYAYYWADRMSILITDPDAYIMNVPEIEQLSEQYGTSTPIIIATEKGLAYSPTVLGDYNNGVIYVSLKKTIKYQNKKMYNLHDVLRHEWRHHWQDVKYPELSQFWSRIEHTLGKTGTQQVNDAYFGNPIEVDARQFSIGNISDDSILKEIEISDTINKKEIAYQCHLLKLMYEE